MMKISRFGAVTWVMFCMFAQSSVAQNRAIIIAHKPLSYDDSVKVKELYFSALREKTIENFKLSTELFNNVLQIDPANDASMYQLANLQRLQNNNNGARELLERAVTVNPDNEWYWVALTDSYEKTNDLLKLENAFNELIRINPDKPDYYYDKANALYILKRYDEALKLYDKVEEITGPSEELTANRQKVYIRQGRVDKAGEALEQQIKDDPTQIRNYLLLAEVYNSNGLNDKALDALKRAQKIAPKNGTLNLAMADIYRDKKNYEASFDQIEIAFANPDVDIDQKLRIVLGYIPKFPDADAKASALELCKVLVATHPNSDKAFAIYGDMLAQNNKLTDAKEAYKKSIQLNPQSYNVFEQLVRLELGDNDADNAVKDGENALSYFPNQAWMNFLVGVAWQQKKDFNKAISYLKNATSLEEDREFLSQVYSSLGDCYHAVNDNKSSDEAYDKALSYNPNNSFTLNNYAYYLSLRNEHLDKAAQMSQLSNQLQQNTASFEDTYAWILFRQKNYTDAKLWMEKAIQHDSNSAGKLEHYGDILFFTGDAAGALQNWIKSKAKGANSPALERKIDEKKYSE